MIGEKKFSGTGSVGVPQLGSSPLLSSVHHITQLQVLTEYFITAVIGLPKRVRPTISPVNHTR